MTLTIEIPQVYEEVDEAEQDRIREFLAEQLERDPEDVIILATV